MNNRTYGIVAAAFCLGLAACGKNPDEGAKQTKVILEQEAAPEQLNASGRPEAPLIDPQKKTVVVLVPPSAPLLVERQQAKLMAERDKVETQIHGLMDDYNDSMRNPASKAKYQEQIAQQLETYKRQSLELFKLQQQAARTAANASGTAEPKD
jgi:hypothetical protein